MNNNTRFDYGRAVEVECANCGVVQIPSRGFSNISCPICNGPISTNDNSHHRRIRRSSDGRELNLLLQDDDTELNWEGQTEVPPCTEDSSMQSITASMQHLSTENATSGLPVQESSGDSLTVGCPSSLGQVGKLSKTPIEGFDEKGESDICQTCGKLNSSRHECIQCYLAIFKRDIISRKKPSFGIYIVPCEKFYEVFAKISQKEATAYQGTEIGIVEENRFLFLYHPQMAIKDVCTVSFEMDRGESFSIISPTGPSTFDVQHILARSEERVFPGTCVELIIKYNGEHNTLHEDKVKMTLLSGKAKLLIIIPTKSHTSIIHSLQQHYSVTVMPNLDRNALRTCHVDLIENIGNLSSICSYLYQYNILTANEKIFLKTFPQPADAIDELLMIIPKKGNILDIFIYILQQLRENQEAARILVQKRLELSGNCRQ